jgi:DNA-binding GntR family transcriptional regulator|nr:GntR family transcriptional regulator [uncultured Rhodopila sp.]
MTAALYLQVARTLQDRIATGTHPIGSLLPTEHMLAEEFGVSRQTVRQAIGHLRTMKLLSARKGIGTRVEASRPHSSYYHSLQSLQDLFQFAADAQYRVTDVERVSVTGREAEELGCRPGRTWLRLTGLRELPGTLGAPGPLCQTIVMIDGRYAEIADTPRVHTRAIFAQIEDRFGVTVTEVHQDIEATLLNAEQAAVLQSEPGSPALLITRRFFGNGRTLIQLTRNLHAAGRFRYSMMVRRDV